MNDTRQTEVARPEAALLPPVNVTEDREGIILYADLPGVTKEGLNLQIEADTVIIEGEIGLEVPEGMEVTHAEVDVSSFRRVFRLSKELDPSKISAQLDHGVLTLRIPKAPHAQPRKIPVDA